ncbi:MAG: zinc-dependent alcohol dehydrogenase family protein [candidate division Zixibacteria bacterium]|nr:zinc-dependent alcohol dehydrogenase family protein [candidate division Zixibacteria bacterium]
MLAMILKEPEAIEKNPLQLVEMEKPKVKPDEILVKIKVCGICHTDLHTVEGELELLKKPLVPGHQVVGVVEEKGEEVTRFKKGDRVGMAWLYSTCGKCKYCLADNENLCENALFTGYHVDGGYAQYTVVSQDFAYPIPEGFSDQQAAPLLCAGIIGYRALRLSQIKPKGKLGLYGFGASAHVAIQVAIHWGCEVFVFTRSKEHQKLAESLGAVWTGQAKDKAPKKSDSAVIFAPAGELVLDALGALDKGGTLALAGIYMTPIPQMDYMKYIYHERTLRSVANSTRKDGEELLGLAAEIPIRTKTTIFPLKEANKALLLLKQSKIDGAGVLDIPEI